MVDIDDGIHIIRQHKNEWIIQYRGDQITVKKCSRDMSEAADLGAVYWTDCVEKVLVICDTHESIDICAENLKRSIENSTSHTISLKNNYYNLTNFVGSSFLMKSFSNLYKEIDIIPVCDIENVPIANKYLAYSTIFITEDLDFFKVFDSIVCQIAENLELKLKPRKGTAFFLRIFNSQKNSSIFKSIDKDFKESPEMEAFMMDMCSDMFKTERGDIYGSDRYY